MCHVGQCFRDMRWIQYFCRWTCGLVLVALAFQIPLAFKVDKVSPALGTTADTVATRAVLLLPPKECANSRVSLESRYGTCEKRTVSKQNQFDRIRTGLKTDKIVEQNQCYQTPGASRDNIPMHVDIYILPPAKNQNSFKTEPVSQNYNNFV